jgi:NifU-like protein involved in Fe-S cluster formation
MTQDLTRHYFDQEEHVFDALEDGHCNYIFGSASNQLGMQINLYFKVEEGTITDAKYNVNGCSTLVAITAFYVEKVIGRNLEDCTDFKAFAIHEIIDLPKNRMDRILLLENAVNACIGQKET